MYDSATNTCRKLPYSGSTPNAAYPASGSIDGVANTTYDVDALFSVPGITYTASSCAGIPLTTSGCSRSSFNLGNGIVTFNSNFGSRTAVFTITWVVPATATEEAGTGTFTVSFN